MTRRDERHVVPLRDLVDHDGTLDCWCVPRFERLCSICGGADSECWNCDGRFWLPCTREDAENASVLIVIHHAADGREHRRAAAEERNHARD